jgi:HSP20 family protein
MVDKNAFSKQLRDLSSANEVEYTEDFFKQTFGSKDDTEVSVTTIKTQTAPRDQQTISHQFSDSDIDEQWLAQGENYDGQLAVDVFQTEKDIIITSTVAGVSKKDLDISMHGDMVTIKGIRRHQSAEVSNDDYFIRECYWGGFSRSIILPLDIIQEGIDATLEQGVLTIRLPKSQRSRNAKIDVKEL